MTPADPPPTVTTPDDCVAYVERVGLCAWQSDPKSPAGLPALETATPWRGDAGVLYKATWSWKDVLHIERRLYYGQILGNGRPAFVSLGFLPYLIAAQGDNDARTLYENGGLARNALVVYEHVARSGPTATNALPWPQGSRHLYLTALQQRFLLTKVGLSGRTRGTYGYIWGMCESLHPDAFRIAAGLRVADARAHVTAHLRDSGVAIDESGAAKLFRWTVPA